MADIILYAGLAGVTVFLGGLLARYFNHHVEESPVKYEIVHSLMSFGAGIMLSAIALVLVPRGMESLALAPLCIAFIGGAIVFMLIDKKLEESGSQNTALLAMLMDYIPETIALGALFASDLNGAILLAVFIGLQNLPEAFNSYRELVTNGFTERKTLVIFFFASFIGIAGALLGYFLLQDQPTTTALMMTFAAGGILYLLVQDIIPESKLESNHTASLAATLGFLVGVIGEMIL